MGCTSSTPNRPAAAPGANNNAPTAHTGNNASPGNRADDTTSSPRTVHVMMFLHPTEDQLQQAQRKESLDDVVSGIDDPSLLSPCAGSASMKIGLDKLSTSAQIQSIEYYPHDDLQLLIRFISLGSRVQTLHACNLIKRLISSISARPSSMKSSLSDLRIVVCGDDSTVKTVMNKLVVNKVPRLDLIPISVIPITATAATSQFQQISSHFNWGNALPSPLMGESMSALLSRLTVIASGKHCPSTPADAWSVKFIRKSQNPENDNSSPKNLDNDATAIFVTQMSLESASPSRSHTAAMSKYVEAIKCGGERVTVDLDSFKTLVFQNAPSETVWPKDAASPKSGHGEFKKQEFDDEILELVGMGSGYRSSNPGAAASTPSKTQPLSQKAFYKLELHPDHANMQIFLDGCPFQPPHDFSSIEIRKLATFTILHAPADLQTLVTSNALSKPLTKNPTQRIRNGKVLDLKALNEVTNEDPFVDSDDWDRPEGTRPARTIVFFVNPSSGGFLASAYTKIQSPTIRFTNTSNQPAHAIGINELRHGATLHIVNLTSQYEREKGIRTILNAHYPYAIACGGDGTVRWVMSLLSDSVKRIPIGVVPFGTGNDMSRVLGWGGTAPSKLTGHSLECIRSTVDDFLVANQRDLDVWGIDVVVRGGGKGKLVKVQGSTEIESTPQGAGHSRSAVLHEMLTMINYFSCGADAEMVFEFEKRRKQSQAANMVEYARQGAIQTIIAPHYVNTFLRSVLDGNGDPISIDLSSSRILLFPNIHSYGGGQDLWADRAGTQPGHSKRPSRTDSGVQAVVSQSAIDEVANRDGSGDLKAYNSEENETASPQISGRSPQKRPRRASISANFLPQDFGDGILEMMSIRATNSVGVKIATAGVVSLGIKKAFQSAGYSLEFVQGKEFYIQVDGEALRCTDVERIDVFRQSQKALVLQRGSGSTSTRRRTSIFSIAQGMAAADSTRAPSDSINTHATAASNAKLAEEESKFSRAELLAQIRSLRMELDRAREERDRYRKLVEDYELKFTSPSPTTNTSPQDHLLATNDSSIPTPSAMQI